MDRRTAASKAFSILATCGAAALVGATVATDHGVLLGWSGGAATAFGLLGLLALMVTAKRELVPDRAPATVYNVTSTSGPAIGHVETVHFGHQRFELTDEVLEDICSQLDRSRPVALFWVSTGRTPVMAAKLEAYLLKNGFELRGKTSWAQGPVSLDRPVVVSADGLSGGGVTILGGQQVVGLDASAG